jgi:hypothetical protein
MFPIGEDTCTGAILYPSEACAVHVSFAPTALGEKSGALLFITNTPAINVAGIDGIGVAPEPAVIQAPAPTHTHSPADQSADATTAGASAAPPAPPRAEPASAPRPSLIVARLPRLLHLLGHTTLDPGADVRCPVASQGCQSLTYMLTDGAHGSTRGHGHRGPALLGSAIGQLPAGKAAPVRVRLNRHAIARLKRNGHLDVRVGVIVQSAGVVVAQRSWTMKLSSSGPIWRAG